MALQSLGIMLDCSRNAVMSPEKVKEFATLIAGMGYNMLQLYTEDTYEIDGEPFFGYMRGRYTKEELKDIDAHCRKVGIELIPCIQTLAHLNCLTNWPQYQPIFDMMDVLLVGDERVYQLIDKMFATLAECFSSRRVHIGMDEAHGLGRGKYLDIHGPCNRSLLMAEHLTKVVEIANKYGFNPMMWSDMFIRLNNNGDYYGDNLAVPQETVDAVPAGVELVYWDYYSTDHDHYENMFRTHAKFHNPIVFAGGIWTWGGLSPNLHYSLDIAEAAMGSLQNYNVKTAFFTMWGDNGKDCSQFAAMPALFAAAQMARGNFDRADIAKKFEQYTGYTFDEFMDLELPNITGEERSHRLCPSKYLLFNDPFIGLLDFTISDELAQFYADSANKVRPSANGRRFDYLFDYTAKLLDALSVKCDLGVRLRKAYAQGDKTALIPFVEKDIPVVIEKFEALYNAFRTLWLTENKGFGLEVQETRFGGMLLRLRSCQMRLQELIDGKIDKIDELEAKQEAFVEDSIGKRIEFFGFANSYTACPL